MKKRISFFLAYFLFWFLFFIVCRIFFLVYHFHLTKTLAFADMLRTFFYGSRMDLSMAGYLTVLPGIILIFSVFLGGKAISKILNIYTIVVLFVVSFLVIADLELYRNWGFRLDTTPLLYLKNPEEVAGSVNKLIAIILIIFWLLFYTALLYLYLKYIGRKLKALDAGNWTASLVLFVLTLFLFLPIRGSLKMAPMNTGYVYFHNSNVYANHAAVNVIWNALYSLTEYNKEKTYNYFDNKKAEQIFSNIYANKGTTRYLLKANRPNVIVLIMESLTAKIVEPLGGLKGITPRFTELCKEGILFNNFYATADRTDKGIISVLSGYPGHPTRAIVNFSKKTETLPFLNYDLQQHGYYGEFVYGYDADYANFRSYLMNAKYNKIISKADFDVSERNSKWGVHDNYAMNRLFDECNLAQEPFFMAFASQSAHEPFDVPMKRVIQGNDEDHLFLNSAYFADSVLNAFIGKAKKTDWWKNTLIVITADHGTRYPGNTPQHEPIKFHIPMLWIGGAVSIQDTIVDTYCSQADVALTVLHQLEIDNKQYRFSQDIFGSEVSGFAFCLFSDGFTFLKKDGQLIFDNVSRKPMLTKGNADQNFIDTGKAYLQVLTNDFKNRDKPIINK
jgi:phosphoglycerol transferase MdoB-like AlkP superfamily enzyme